jgi:hypothetical protein
LWPRRSPSSTSMNTRRRWRRRVKRWSAVTRSPRSRRANASARPRPRRPVSPLRRGAG